jgi:hypothetical protein
VDYIKEHYKEIEEDMNHRNSSSIKRKHGEKHGDKHGDKHADKDPATMYQMFLDNKTRKKREELSISACKCIKKESVSIVVKFND